MNRDTLKGQWLQVKGQIRQEWGKLTDDDLDRIQGSAEMLIGRIQELYGKTREQAERDFDYWLAQQRALAALKQSPGERRSRRRKIA